MVSRGWLFDNTPSRAQKTLKQEECEVEGFEGSNRLYTQIATGTIYNWSEGPASKRRIGRRKRVEKEEVEKREGKGQARECLFLLVPPVTGVPWRR